MGIPTGGGGFKTPSPPVPRLIRRADVVPSPLRWAGGPAGSRIGKTNARYVLTRLIRRVPSLCATVVSSFPPDPSARLHDHSRSNGQDCAHLGFDSIKPHRRLLCVLGPHIDAAGATERSPSLFGRRFMRSFRDCLANPHFHAVAYVSSLLTFLCRPRSCNALRLHLRGCLPSSGADYQRSG